uniref:C-C motif chemokine n=1 Tax=Electrophorus electricus TaxID=8005 RepID=A0AAY5F3J8_ELEEL
MHANNLTLLKQINIFSTTTGCANGHVMCCFDFHDSKIPVNFITKYEPTSSECPKAGVVFTTQKGVYICTHPSFKWVWNAIDRIDQCMVESST